MEQEILCLLKNIDFRQALNDGQLQNLEGYKTFNSTQQYIQQFLPLFKNEFFDSYKQDQNQHKQWILDKSLFPLVYTCQLSQDQDDDLRFDCSNEQKNIFKKKGQWKFNHFVDYLRFKDTKQYIISFYYENDQNEIQSNLGILYNSSELREMIAPYSRQLKDNFYNCSRTVYIQPLSNIGCYTKELSALQRLASCPFRDLILNPNDRNNIVQPTSFGSKVTKQQQLFFNNSNYISHFNQYQLTAIQESLNYQTKVTLIEGPPGTGKTQTTLGIISIISRMLNTEQKGAILILAKSNSVVNDFVRKISQSIHTENSIINCTQTQSTDINLIRLGRSEKCEADVLEFNFQCQSQNRFFKKYQNKVDSLRRYYIDNYIKNLMRKKKIISYEQYQDQLYADLNRNQKQKRLFYLESLLNYIQDEVNSKTRNSDILYAFDDYYFELMGLLKKHRSIYDEIQNEIIEKCNVFVSTINSCSNQFTDRIFEQKILRMFIVDEAPTAVEPSQLIPFVNFHSLQKIVLLGDTKQLNPIVISNSSRNYGYNSSMFHRFTYCIKDSQFQLRYQYRQMANLSSIISNVFYNNTLLNGNNNMQMPNNIQMKVKRNRLLFNTPKWSEQKKETSSFNPIEAKAIIQLIDYLLKGNKIQQQQITIIVAYSAQRDEIYKLLQNKEYFEIGLDTVDSFQGKENDIVIISMVRSGSIVGFIGDKRRTNVALSRAKYCTYLFCCEYTLKQNATWKQIIKHFSNAREIVEYTTQSLQNRTFFQTALQN